MQIIYERGLRPAEKQHEPWIERVTGQLQAALAGLESELVRRPLATSRADMTQAGVTAAVGWHFIQRMLPQLAPDTEFPALADLSVQAEALAVFKAAPFGDGVCVPAIDPD